MDKEVHLEEGMPCNFFHFWIGGVRFSVVPAVAAPAVKTRTCSAERNAERTEPTCPVGSRIRTKSVKIVRCIDSALESTRSLTVSRILIDSHRCSWAIATTLVPKTNASCRMSSTVQE